MTTDRLDLAAIRARAEAATPGPWGLAAVDGHGFGVHRGEHDTIALYAARPDAAHIAGLDPQTVLTLLDAAAAARDPKGYLWSDQWAWAVERERALKAKVARVEALCDEAQRTYVGALSGSVTVESIRAALAGDTETGADE